MLCGKYSGNGSLSATLSTAFVQDGGVMQCNTIHDLPNRGNTKTVYFIKSEDASYRWDEENSKYFCVGRDYNEIEVIICGGNA